MMKYYVRLEDFTLPDSPVSWALDVIPTDGRLLIANGTELLREQLPRTRRFERVVELPSDPPGVLRISPSGVKAVLISSAGNSLVVFDPRNGHIISRTASGDGNFFFDAEWYNDTVLAVTEALSGRGPTVKVFNLEQEQSKVVIRNIGAASGGVTFGQDGSLFAGNGYSSGGDDETGLIKVYSLAIWQQAWDNDRPIDFEDRTVGTAVANLLSGAYLGFDRFDNFHIGGGDISSSAPDSNYAAVVFKGTLENILRHQGSPVTPRSPSLPESSSGVWQRLDPDPQQNLAWLVHANRVTGELLLKAYEKPTVYNHFLVTEETRSGVREVMVEANYQLGDNPGFYRGSAFVGFELNVPLLLPSFDVFNGDLTLVIETQYIETFGGQSRHRVSLGGEHIGDLKDDQNRTDNERFSFNIPRDTLEAILMRGNPTILTINAQPLAGNLSDDFLVRKYGYRVTL